LYAVMEKISKKSFRRQFCSALLSGNIVQYFLYVFRRDV